MGVHLKLQLYMMMRTFTMYLRQEGMIFLRLFTIKKKLNVLEVGSGRGFCTNWLAEALPLNNFYGVDIVGKHVNLSNLKRPLTPSSLLQICLS